MKTLIRWFFFGLFLFFILNAKMMVWLALFGICLLLATLFGRIYCGYVCPMNTLMIPTEVISKKLKLQTDNTPSLLQSDNLGWASLGISIGLMVFFQKILNKNMPILIIWLIASVLITLRYKPSVFHNKICPFGVIQKIFGRYARYSENVDQNNCIGCKKCEKVCPSEAIKVKEDKKAYINTEYCFECTNCVSICPTNTISYTKTKM